MSLQEPSFIDHITEGCYLANNSFYTIGVLNAKVKFSGKFPNFKLDAMASVDFSFGCLVRNVNQHVFVRNDSQCGVTSLFIRLGNSMRP